MLRVKANETNIKRMTAKILHVIAFKKLLDLESTIANNNITSNIQKCLLQKY